MMHGHEKSDPALVAEKPANKAKEAHCGHLRGRTQRSFPQSVISRRFRFFSQYAKRQWGLLTELLEEGSYEAAT